MNEYTCSCKHIVGLCIDSIYKYVVHTCIWQRVPNSLQTTQNAGDQSEKPATSTLSSSKVQVSSLQ